MTISWQNCMYGILALQPPVRAHSSCSRCCTRPQQLTHWLRFHCGKPCTPGRTDPSDVTCMQMCILAGCDFLKAIPGIGIRKAHAQIRQLKSFTRVRHRFRPACKHCTSHGR